MNLNALTTGPAHDRASPDNTVQLRSPWTSRVHTQMALPTVTILSSMNLHISLSRKYSVAGETSQLIMTCLHERSCHLTHYAEGFAPDSKQLTITPKKTLKLPCAAMVEQAKIEVFQQNQFGTHEKSPPLKKRHSRFTTVHNCLSLKSRVNMLSNKLLSRLTTYNHQPSHVTAN